MSNWSLAQCPVVRTALKGLSSARAHSDLELKRGNWMQQQFILADAGDSRHQSCAEMRRWTPIALALRWSADRPKPSELLHKNSVSDNNFKLDLLQQD